MHPIQENRYQIRVQGLLNPKWADWFDGFAITSLEGDSLLTGRVLDQAALHGILAKIRDLGLTLVYIQQENRMDLTDENIRPFDIRRDLDSMTNLIEAAFAGELQNWGGDFREQMRMTKQTLPMLSILSRLSPNFQHVFDGFVCEDQGRIVSMVNVQKVGFDTKRWLIGNVATHPDYQRRGLARKLVARAIEHARTYGAEVVMLDVRTAAQPAYSLYRSLGFAHYDSATSLKLEKLPKITPQAMPGYSLRTMKLDEWQARYQLALNETPPAVQDFLPVSKANFRVLPFEHITGFLAQNIQGVKIQRWAAEKDGQVMAVMTLVSQKNAKIHHELSLRIHPAQRAVLAEPLLTQALAALQGAPKSILRTEIRTSYTDLLDLFKKFGFVEIETNYRMGLKFK
ncbi:MAG: GNAT family N-acetyltransferase [Anaerolineales bacterium]|jgi:ribosomal protein S18 acetylase RimI-like enzyme|nr:GNAT family N-acetyltransferase [Anaerolineales bacterium]